MYQNTPWQLELFWLIYAGNFINIKDNQSKIGGNLKNMKGNLFNFGRLHVRENYVNFDWRQIYLTLLAYMCVIFTILTGCDVFIWVHFYFMGAYMCVETF